MAKKFCFWCSICNRQFSSTTHSHAAMGNSGKCIGQIVCVGGGSATLKGVYFSGGIVEERSSARAQLPELLLFVLFPENVS